MKLNFVYFAYALAPFAVKKNNAHASDIVNPK